MQAECLNKLLQQSIAQPVEANKHYYELHHFSIYIYQFYICNMFKIINFTKKIYYT